jgi:hypothetical protein
MALKLIIDTDAVITRMALQDIAEVRASVDSVLNAAHVVLQGMLHTVFEPTSRTDLFYTQEGLFPKPMDGLLKLRLTQAFVHANVPLVVTKNTISRALLQTEPEVVSADDYFVDTTRGIVHLDVAHLGAWLNVGYTAGFDATHKAPIWLQEAVLSYLPHLMVQPSGAQDSAVMNAANEAQKMAWHVTAKIVEPYLRNQPFSYASYAA